ncbi:hypothetical protein DEQ92_20315 [Haloferax sp. Atlit-6N]|nr:hypothetical protein DEQ92_20315 [Haloferax sp. Atlit-6N]
MLDRHTVRFEVWVPGTVQLVNVSEMALVNHTVVGVERFCPEVLDSPAWRPEHDLLVELAESWWYPETAIIVDV